MQRWILTVVLTCVAIRTSAQVSVTRNALLMGGRFDITLVANDSVTAGRYIDSVIAEVKRIEYLISDWIPQTQVSEVNANAGIKPVKVDKEILVLAERAIKLSQLTGGAFDISFAAMERIWKFDGSMTEMPSPEAVKKARESVGYRHIIINRDSSTIFLQKKRL